MKERIEGLRDLMNNMQVGELLILMNVMIFNEAIWDGDEDENEREFFVKFKGYGESLETYQVFLFEDGSVKFREYDEDEVLDLIEFHNEDLVEEWSNY